MIVFVPVVTLVVVVAQLPPMVNEPPSVVVKVRSGVVSAVGPILDGAERGWCSGVYSDGKGV